MIDFAQRWRDLTPRRKKVALALAALFCTAVITIPIAIALANAGPDKNVHARDDMRQFVSRIAQRAKQRAQERHQRPFFIVPQNGLELLTRDPVNGQSDSPLNDFAIDYLSAIDGVGQEGVHFGLDSFGARTPAKETAMFDAYLRGALQHGKAVFAVDYTADSSEMAESYRQCDTKGYNGFAAPVLEATVVPSYPPVPYRANASSAISALGEACNLLYLLNPDEGFPTRQAFVSQIGTTLYDSMIIDAFFGTDPQEQLTRSDISRLQRKSSSAGPARLVIAYMSVGEAESYRWYWKSTWNHLGGEPRWLEAENPEWEGNYKVQYWDSEWQAIIFEYADKLVDAGFDGAYLDVVDAFWYFS